MHWGASAVTAMKIVHVLFAAAWVGANLFLNYVVLRHLAESAAATRREFSGRILPDTIRYFNIAGGFTLLSGAFLVYAQSDGFLVTGRRGALLAFALIGNVAALYLLNFSVRPSVRAIENAQAGADPAAAPSPGVLFLQRRVRWTSALMLAVLVVVLATMVVASSIAP